ncbi:hypothetical protein PRZ48_008775 [Zasmidium cellare]|uniref:Enoyl reductase (ER) domain-containing protein n=1 Tax=Zasmidium cellare TaxID=395010 RepID=A0ABR0EH74_ZASCE|nr:hypothetical protein PRZ48_008775 [Zasmidium cellare]
MTAKASYANEAAFLVAKNTPLQLGSSSYTPLGIDEMVVKNVAVAVNPYDWIIQEVANIAVSWVKLPFILGTDVAGDIVEVGANVTRFRKGDRVVAHAIGLDKRVNRACEGGFQQYTVIRPNLTSQIPDSMSYETACVIPLAFSTASCGLFQQRFLAIPSPRIDPVPVGKTLLVWGGSTAVGCNAIQLARAAGCEVIATASPKNHEYLMTLGAAKVFDYRSETVVDDIIAAFRGRKTAGAAAIGTGSLNKCIDVLSGCEGSKFVSGATLDLPPFPKSGPDFPRFVLTVVGRLMWLTIKARMNGVRFEMINGSELVANEVGKMVYEDFLPTALKKGKFIPAPPPRVVGHGLEKVQEAMDLSKKGVSAEKLVVRL